MKLRAKHGLIAFGCLLWAMACGCSKIVYTSEVQLNAEPWMLFVPEGTSRGGCRIAVERAETPSKGEAVRFASEGFGRFGIRPRTQGLPVRPGERYRVTAWVKAAPDFQVKSGEPGILLRTTFFGAGSTPYSGPHFHIGLQGVAKNPERLAGAVIPANWRKIDQVIEVPVGADHLKFFTFCWFAAGSFWVDAPKIEKVTSDTPLSQLLADGQ